MEGMITDADRRWMKWMAFGERLGCHQMPERSFFWKGYQFPVCARCTGVIIGEFIAIGMLVWGVRLELWAAAALLAPMGLDWGLQWLELLPSTNLRRLLSGLLGGLGLTYGYYHVLSALVRGIGMLL